MFGQGGYEAAILTDDTQWCDLKDTAFVLPYFSILCSVSSQLILDRA